MTQPENFLGIGELARRTGVASSALRYYERVKLLSPDGRAHGRRYYGASSLERIALIQLHQSAGFTLREIRTLVAARGRRGRLWNSLLDSKLRALEIRIAEAERAKALVQHALGCPYPDMFECPKFRAVLQERLGLPAARPGKHRRSRRRSPGTRLPRRHKK
jgi:DNA-binding transcriptional MerR regulator